MMIVKEYRVKYDCHFLSHSLSQDMEIEDLQEKQRLLSTTSSGPATLAVDPAASSLDAQSKHLSLLGVTRPFGSNKYVRVHAPPPPSVVRTNILGLKH